MTAPLRVALADDQAILRSGLAALLRLESDLEVVGEAATCAEALDVVAPSTASRSPSTSSATAAAPGSSC